MCALAVREPIVDIVPPGRGVDGVPPKQVHTHSVQAARAPPPTMTMMTMMYGLPRTHSHTRTHTCFNFGLIV